MFLYVTSSCAAFLLWWAKDNFPLLWTIKLYSILFYSIERVHVRFMNGKYLILKRKLWIETKSCHGSSANENILSALISLLCWHWSHGWSIAVLIKYCNSLLGQWGPYRACQSASFPQSEKWKHSVSGTRGRNEVWKCTVASLFW